MMSMRHLKSVGLPFVFYFHVGSLEGFTLPPVLSMRHLKSLGPTFCTLPPFGILDPWEALPPMMSMRPLESSGFVLYSASISDPWEALRVLLRSPKHQKIDEILRRGSKRNPKRNPER